MSKTIEKRLDILISEQTAVVSAMNNPHATPVVTAGRLEIRDTTRNAIIEEWNTAVKLLQQIPTAFEEYLHESSKWGYNDNDNNAWDIIEQAQILLAKMEGN